MSISTTTYRSGTSSRRRNIDKAHDIHKVEFIGTTMLLHVDGKKYEIEIAEWSEPLAMATQEQRERFEVTPAGYGLHWQDVDEDLSIDGLIGVKHSSPAAETTKMSGSSNNALQPTPGTARLAADVRDGERWLNYCSS